MSKWHLIENQPLLREIYKDPSLLSYRKDVQKRRTCKSKLALKVIFFLSRPIGALLDCLHYFNNNNNNNNNNMNNNSFP